MSSSCRDMGKSLEKRGVGEAPPGPAASISMWNIRSAPGAANPFIEARSRLFPYDNDTLSKVARSPPLQQYHVVGGKLHPQIVAPGEPGEGRLAEETDVGGIEDVVPADEGLGLVQIYRRKARTARLNILTLAVLKK
ncbi:hypothetical protein ACGTNG_03800 [Halomonas sp. 1390]|uniref:hypothetical protein n=1 Tax=Halomonas sp. B23F22_3 TaxID=3459516 RepID=UPI00373EA4A3